MTFFSRCAQFNSQLHHLGFTVLAISSSVVKGISLDAHQPPPITVRNESLEGDPLHSKCNNPGRNDDFIWLSFNCFSTTKAKCYSSSSGDLYLQTIFNHNQTEILRDVHSQKLTWQMEIPVSNRKDIFEWPICHCRDSFRGNTAKLLVRSSGEF